MSWGVVTPARRCKVLSNIQLRLGQSFLFSASRMPALIRINYVFFPLFPNYCFWRGEARSIKSPLVTENYLWDRISYFWCRAVFMGHWPRLGNDLPGAVGRAWTLLSQTRFWIPFLSLTACVRVGKFTSSSLSFLFYRMETGTPVLAELSWRLNELILWSTWEALGTFQVSFLCDSSRFRL